jgi:Fe-S cluster assembly protein SufD
VTFVDGRVERIEDPRIAGLRILSLTEAFQQEEDLVRAHLGRYAAFENESFTALNTAFLHDGVLLHVGRGRVVDAPIVLRFVSTASSDPTMSFPRVLVVAEESSSVAIVESYVGDANGVYFTNAVTEVAVGANASVVHCKIQRESGRAFHVGRIEARQEASSRFGSYAISLGAALARTDIGTVFEGEGGECTFDGLYMADGQQHVDHHTSIDHRRSSCASRELYKGVLGGRSSGVFNGKVTVRPDAQKTDAQQVNKNLLLSEAATINTKPQLEIFADDVKCSHGATIGRLDEKALFYLRSRGIDEAAARELLIGAFANELVGRIRVEAVREPLLSILASKLGSPSAIEAVA